MANVLVGKHGTGQIAHDLMHINQNLRRVFGIKSGRLNLGVDLTPLFSPVRTNFIRPLYKTAFKRFRPSHVGSHEGESCVNVTRVKSRVRSV